MVALRNVLFLSCLCFAACGGQASTANESAGNPPTDASTQETISPTDASTDVSADASADASTEEASGPAPACTCPTGQVWRMHACLSTLDLGCGPSCTSGVTLCGQYETCEPCGAASACATHDCLATCVPTELHQGPIAADSLRVVPSEGAAGASTEVTVFGFPWYIGALGYAARVGTETTVQFGGGSDCAFTFEVPANSPGRMPIYISQYGSTDSWVLAGFFTYSGGDTDTCIQPGYPCADSESCCTTSDAPVSCSSWRCRAQ
jgi:hypothetical protein